MDEESAIDQFISLAATLVKRGGECRTVYFQHVVGMLLRSADPQYLNKVIRRHVSEADPSALQQFDALMNPILDGSLKSKVLGSLEQSLEDALSEKQESIRRKKEMLEQLESTQKRGLFSRWRS